MALLMALALVGVCATQEEYSGLEDEDGDNTIEDEDYGKSHWGKSDKPLMTYEEALRKASSGQADKVTISRSYLQHPCHCDHNVLMVTRSLAL